MVEVIDEYLSPSYFNFIKDMVESSSFPWEYTGDITDNISNHSDSLKQFGFSHSIYNFMPYMARDNDYAKTVRPALLTIQDSLDCDIVQRARFDMTVYSETEHIHSPHIDLDHSCPFYSVILYINDSDGETIFYEQTSINTSHVIGSHHDYTVMKTVEPKANRLVVFDGRIIHTGKSPSKNKRRILLNANFTSSKFEPYEFN